MTAAGPIVLMAHRLGRVDETGIDRYVAELTDALARLDGGDDYLLTATGERLPPRRMPAVPLRRIPGPRPLVHAAWTLLHRPRIEQLLRVRPRLVHVLAPIVPVPTSVPLVVTVHDLTPLQLPGRNVGRERYLFRRAIDHAVRHADHLVTDSEAVASDVTRLLAYPRDRITVVPLGVAPPFFAPPAPSARHAVTRRHGLEPGRYFIHLGMLNDRKNVISAVRAFAMARPSLPAGAVLFLAGPRGPEAEHIEDEVRRRGLEDVVRYGGYLPGADLPALLADAVALVHPALYEGFGLTPLEAMAAGTAVIASDAGALPEVVGDVGILLHPFDVDGWAQAMVRVWEDHDLRASLEQRGRQRAALFTWDAAAQKTRAVHRGLLSLPS